MPKIENIVTLPPEDYASYIDKDFLLLDNKSDTFYDKIIESGKVVEYEFINGKESILQFCNLNNLYKNLMETSDLLLENTILKFVIEDTEEDYWLNNLSYEEIDSVTSAVTTVKVEYENYPTIQEKIIGSDIKYDEDDIGVDGYIIKGTLVGFDEVMIRPTNNSYIMTTVYKGSLDRRPADSEVIDRTLSKAIIVQKYININRYGDITNIKSMFIRYNTAVLNELGNVTSYTFGEWKPFFEIRKNIQDYWHRNGKYWNYKNASDFIRVYAPLNEDGSTYIKFKTFINNIITIDFGYLLGSIGSHYNSKKNNAIGTTLNFIMELYRDESLLDSEEENYNKILSINTTFENGDMNGSMNNMEIKLYNETFTITNENDRADINNSNYLINNSSGSYFKLINFIENETEDFYKTGKKLKVKVNINYINDYKDTITYTDESIYDFDELNLSEVLPIPEEINGDTI